MLKTSTWPTWKSSLCPAGSHELWRYVQNFAPFADIRRLAERAGRELAIRRTIRIAGIGEVAPEGFEEPLRPYEI